MSVKPGLVAHPCEAESVKRRAGQEVCDWIEEQYPATLSTLHMAVIKHSISGRALLRLKDHHLQRLGVQAERQDILQDVLLLRVREEVENLNDIYAECFAS